MSVKDFWNEQAAAEKKLMTSVELPEGTYTAEVVKCEFGKTAAGGNKVFWDLKVTSGEYANCRQFIHSKYSLTDESDENRKDITKMLDFFKALDLPCSSDKIAASMAFIVGKKIEFKIVAGKMGGKFTNFVRVIPETQAAPRNPIDDDIPF